MRRRRSGSDAGFTLIEVIVALALFALVAVAGMALVQSVLKIQAHTGTRLDRLGDMQRTMFVIANDLQQLNGGPVTGDAASVRFSRPLAAFANLPQSIAYGFAGGVLVRSVANGGGQPLLDGVAATRWRYFHAGDGWLDHWPPTPSRAGEWPEAVSLEIALQPARDRPGGTLRRIVALPSQP